MSARDYTIVIALSLTVALSGISYGQKSSSSRSSGKTEPRTISKSGEVSSRTSIDNSIVNPASFNNQALSQMVFELTNRERQKAGLPSCSQNRYLANSATAHSQDMASRGYFNHKSKGFFNRTDPRDRAAAAGYNPGMIAENIAMIPTYNSTRIQTVSGYGPQIIEADYNSYRRLAEYAMQEWMKSPGHRKNILNGRLTTLGVGTAIGIQNNVPYVYLTQNFGG